eukprot:1347602-Amorphochlora_amoeboformis.AAC.1
MAHGQEGVHVSRRCLEIAPALAMPWLRPLPSTHTPLITSNSDTTLFIILTLALTVNLTKATVDWQEKCIAISQYALSGAVNYTTQC